MKILVDKMNTWPRSKV